MQTLSKKQSYRRKQKGLLQVPQRTSKMLLDKKQQDVVKQQHLAIQMKNLPIGFTQLLPHLPIRSLQYLMHRIRVSQLMLNCQINQRLLLSGCQHRHPVFFFPCQGLITFRAKAEMRRNQHPLTGVQGFNAFRTASDRSAAKKTCSGLVLLSWVTSSLASSPSESV